jgi:hypothetical protein
MLDHRHHGHEDKDHYHQDQGILDTVLEEQSLDF